MNKKPSVAIIGAGFIAQEHIQVVNSLPEVKLRGVFDIRKEKAYALSKKFNIPEVFESAEKIINEKLCDSVHIVVPPHFHMQAAIPFLEAGINVFMEKPLAVTSEECQKLADISKKTGARLCVNHNFTFNPIYLKLKDLLKKGNLGNLHHVNLIFNVPLRQLSSKQFGHWMFQSPENILLELGVHPLSQIYDLAGEVIKFQCLASDSVEITPGVVFYKSWQISMECKKATAQLFFSVGQDYSSEILTVICEDGQFVADYENNLLYTQTKTKWPEFFNSFLNGINPSFQLINRSFKNINDFFLSTAKIKERTDTFYTGFFNSIQAFYAGHKSTQPCASAQTGTNVIKICEMLADTITLKHATPQKTTRKTEKLKDSYDVLVTGGTGFIGKKVVEQLVKEGKTVVVTARNTNMLPEIFNSPQVTTITADIADKDKMDSIIKKVSVVIHLAHGGGGDTYEEIKNSMIQGTVNIAKSCIKYKIKHLSYISTIAALYLGNKGEIITGSTPVDPIPEKRPAYSRGKAQCEKILKEMHAEEDLAVSILRPGIVIGEDGVPFHSGLGIFNQDKYCIGWNEGTNPLAFVLLSDVSNAICLDAFSQKTIGKAYNIVGDVRLTGREYIRELGKTLGRKLYFLPQPIQKTQAIEVGKWLIKVFIQKRKVSFPSYRDLKSRGMVATFDCSDFKADLGWKPEDDRNKFLEKGILVYRNCKKMEQ